MTYYIDYIVFALSLFSHALFIDDHRLSLWYHRKQQLQIAQLQKNVGGTGIPGIIYKRKTETDSHTHTLYLATVSLVIINLLLHLLFLYTNPRLPICIPFFCAYLAEIQRAAEVSSKWQKFRFSG